MFLTLLNSRVPMTALAILLVFISGSLIAASNDTRTKAVLTRHDEASFEPTPPPYSVKQQGQMIDIGSVLNEEILRLVKVSEPDWELVKNKWSSGSESSIKIWKSGDKYLSVVLIPYESRIVADEKFSKTTDPRFSSLGIEGKEVPGIGDRHGSLKESKPIGRADLTYNTDLTFVVDRFVVSIAGLKPDVLRFAKHFEELLRAHSKRDKINK